MPGGIARSLRVTAQRSGQGSKTAAEAASAAQMRADLDGENGVARWVQQQTSLPTAQMLRLGGARSGNWRFRTTERLWRRTPAESILNHVTI